MFNTLKSDNAIMARVKAGEISELAILFKRYNKAIYSYTYRILGHKEESEDVTQNVFYRILKYRHTFSDELSFRPWIYQLTRNLIYDELKKRKKISYDDIDRYSETSKVEETCEACDSSDIQDFLHLALNKLKLDDKELLVLSRYQNLKYSEIAKIFNTTEGAIKVRVYRILRELKKDIIILKQQA